MTWSRTRFVSILLTLALLTIRSTGQRNGSWPTPPAPAVRENMPVSAPKKSHATIDRPAMEREAKEMSALASSVPDDIQQLSRGLLPSDAIDKLKRIEKLSKQLRQQIKP
jgi:hypothetical protein